MTSAFRRTSGELVLDDSRASKRHDESSQELHICDYYSPDPALVEAAMRASETFNRLLAEADLS